jgi:hypothetical protein
MFLIQPKKFVYKHLLRATGNLNPRLFPDANVPGSRSMLRTLLKRQGQDSESSYRLDIP